MSAFELFVLLLTLWTILVTVAYVRDHHKIGVLRQDVMRLSEWAKAKERGGM